MGYKYILFDFDGTISDSKEGVIDSAIYVLGLFGITVDDRESLKYMVGPPLYDTFRDVECIGVEKADYAVSKYREYYQANCNHKNYLFPGVREMLVKLKAEGKILAVATSKFQYTAENLLKEFGILEYIDFVSGHNEAEGRTDKAAVVEYAIEQLGITDKTEAVMVGDRKYDINGAKAVGIDSIAVLYGYGDVPEFEAAGATYIAETTEDVIKLVL